MEIYLWLMESCLTIYTRALTGAGEGNRTLVVSLGSSTRNPATMRAYGPFLLRKSDIIAAVQTAIHAVHFTFVEQDYSDLMPRPIRYTWTLTEYARSNF